MCLLTFPPIGHGNHDNDDDDKNELSDAMYGNNELPVVSVIPLRRPDSFKMGADGFGRLPVTSSASRMGGAVGFHNLGNTCYMNSALQCLAHTPALTEYFLDNLHKVEVNTDNPLGSKGELANAVAKLFQEMWLPRR